MADEKQYPVEPVLGALDVSQLVALLQSGSETSDEWRRTAYMALSDLDRASGSLPIKFQPKLVFYYGSEHEKLLTAHGLFFLEPHGGKWYWANVETPLPELCERFAGYADYFLDRSQRQLAIYQRDLELCESASLPGTAYLREQIESLAQQIAYVEAKRVRDSMLPG